MAAHEEYQLLGLLTYNALLVLFAGVSQPAVKPPEGERRGSGLPRNIGSLHLFSGAVH